MLIADRIVKTIRCKENDGNGEIMKNTLFLGNGINRWEGNKQISWGDILEQLAQDNHLQLAFEDNNKLAHLEPYTFFYERVVLSASHHNYDKKVEENIKEKIAEELHSVVPSPYLKQFLTIPHFQNIITTNYDYGIEAALQADAFQVTGNDSSETIYSIRRKRELMKESTSCTIWHIHGEINDPKSIMLGLDHYCGGIGKINDYIKGTYYLKNKQKRIGKMTEKIASNQFDDDSWLDLFFHSNLFFVGFGLDYSENDIWWVLNKRARIWGEMKLAKTKKNKVYYYANIIDLKKKLILQDFDVEVIEINDPDWAQYYAKVMKDIKEKTAVHN